MNQTSECLYGGKLNELALFAGAGGGILGGHILGWRTVCAVECNSYASDVLIARQNDGCLPPFPIWDDVRTFDGRRWRGVIDVVSGGFPCQDISSAGKGAGINGGRSGLWKEFARIICEVRPRFAFVENSPVLTSRGLGTVLGDLASMGYDAEWCVLGADDVGAPHRRKRIWILAYSASLQCYGGEYYREPDSEPSLSEPRDSCREGGGVNEQEPTLAYPGCEFRAARDTTELDTKTQIWSSSTVLDQSSYNGQNVYNSDSTQRKGMCKPERAQQWYAYSYNSGWWQAEPIVGRVADGVAFGVDKHGANSIGGVGRLANGVQSCSERLLALGNGQVPSTAALAWNILYGRISSHLIALQYESNKRRCNQGANACKQHLPRCVEGR